MDPLRHIGVGTPAIHEDERPGTSCPDCDSYMADVVGRHRQNFVENWKGVTFASVPGGATGTRKGGLTPLESQKKFDQDLDSYRETRKTGLQPEASTKKAVEEAEARAESFDRVAKMEKEGKFSLTPELKQTLKAGMGE